MKTIQYFIQALMLIALVLLATACSTEEMVQETTSLQTEIIPHPEDRVEQLRLPQVINNQESPVMKQVWFIRNTGGRRASPINITFVDWDGNTHTAFLHNRDAGIQLQVKDELILEIDAQFPGFSEPTTYELVRGFSFPARPIAQNFYDDYLWGDGGYNSNVVGYTLYWP